MSKPFTKLYLQSLVKKANEEEKRLPNESELDRVKRLLTKSSVDSITDNVKFHAKLGNIFFNAQNLSKELLLDIYDGVKINFPDCKIYLNTDECSMMVHWG